jgi:hypothetical protein
MKLFNIYVKKSENDSIEDLVVVKSSFSYLAFIFSFFWFLQHKMWKESLVFIVVNSFLALLFHKNFFGSFDFIIMEAGLLAIIGLNCGYWFEQNLLKNKYQFVGNVFGQNKDEAKLRFISNCFKVDEENQPFSPNITDLKPKPKKTNQYFTI